jgi:hypothetical protein
VSGAKRERERGWTAIGNGGVASPAEGVAL